MFADIRGCVILMLIAVGTVLEAVAILAMVSYRLRRWLPFKSPLDLHGIGGWLIIAAVALALITSVFF